MLGGLVIKHDVRILLRTTTDINRIVYDLAFGLQCIVYGQVQRQPAQVQGVFWIGISGQHIVLSGGPAAEQKKSRAFI